MQTYIPKWIVIVIEDDIINSSTYDKSRASSFFGNVLEHLMKEHNTIMDEFKAMIPQKAKKHGWPFFLWVKPTSHKFYDNKDLRDKFNKCLTTVETLHDNVLALNLEQIWDQNDRAMFQTATQKLSATGYNTFWKALDRTIRYADLNVIRYGNKKMKDIFLEKRKEVAKKSALQENHLQRRGNGNYSYQQRNNDRFHWNSRQRRHDRENTYNNQTVRRRIDFDDPNQYRLPPPPPQGRRKHEDVKSPF